MMVQLQRRPPAPRPDAPAPAEVHRFDTADGRHLLVMNGSRIFTLEDAVAAVFDGGEAGDVAPLLEELGLAAPPYVDDAPVHDPPVRALSLAIAQKCNLGCTYCYAQQGEFGGPARDMTPEAARGAVDLLFAEAGPGDAVNLAFMGGEPLTNRALLRECTERAAAMAAARGVRIGFSVTTNGTLLRPDDGAFFERHGFAVTVSLDGVGETHDRLRPYRGGRGSYQRVLENVRPLLAMQRAMQVSARVTVTPANLALRETLDAFLDLGFHSVGFSPMLSSPAGTGEMGEDALGAMLEQMIACGDEFQRRVRGGERYAFLNMANAMRQLHRGTHRPYPCGAGAGYLGVSADGALSACHRFVEDPAGQMGDVRSGVDRHRQRAWLDTRHVHRQEPCRSCWARYLCGGGCHHEVIRRGRPACEYIRGWLHYCLQAYVTLLGLRPAYFEA
jgi:uncharacterized protein